MGIRLSDQQTASSLADAQRYGLEGGYGARAPSSATISRPGYSWRRPSSDSLFSPIYPAAQNFFLGTQLARRGVANTAFICLDNFASLITSRLQDAHYYILSDGFIWHAENARYLVVFGNSVFFSVFIVLVANVLGLAIALLASQKIRGASVYRTLMIWPYAISGVVVGIVFAILLGGGGSGFLNQVLRLFGAEPVPFLSDSWWARVSVGAAAAWNKLGFNVLIYIAALQSVPMELDGGRFDRWRQCLEALP